jgi:UDP-N-acetylmuramate--alanine ligase
MFFSPQPLHFTGIGGIGMSALARIARAQGCPVSGSDLKRSAMTGELEALGIRIHEGHAAENVPAEARALVMTTAAAPGNPEVLEARRRGLPLVRRGELLAEMMRGMKAVAVAGSHGKTTTSSMIASMTLAAGLDPTAAIGARLPAFDNANARLGSGDLFVAESDESDGSFLELAPTLAVVTNIDREHLDHYGTFDAVRAAFGQFVNRISVWGSAFACIDDPFVRELVPRSRRRIVTYGRGEDAQLRVVSESSGADGGRFRLRSARQDLGDFHVPALGAHNVLNAAAAVGACLELGMSADTARETLAAFRGASRRMELKGTAGGVTVIDDYGHHPTEIRATLAALRTTRPKRLLVLFQPHRYTRTQALMAEFAGAFGDADAVRVCDLYEASEPAIPGVTSEALAREISANGHRDARYTASLDESIRGLAGELQEGDVVLTLGAGSVTTAGPGLLKILLAGQKG